MYLAMFSEYLNERTYQLDFQLIGGLSTNIWDLSHKWDARI